MDHTWHPGDVIDVDEAEARRLQETRQAEPVDADRPDDAGEPGDDPKPVEPKAARGRRRPPNPEP
jgi:hypothetical protein